MVLSIVALAALAAGYGGDRTRWCALPDEFSKMAPGVVGERAKLSAGNYAAMCALLDGAVQRNFYRSPVTVEGPECFYGMTNEAAVHLDAAAHRAFWARVYEDLTNATVMVGQNGVVAYPTAIGGDYFQLPSSSGGDNGWVEVGGYYVPFQHDIRYVDTGEIGGDPSHRFLRDYLAAVESAGWDVSAFDESWMSRNSSMANGLLFGEDVNADIRSGDELDGRLSARVSELLGMLNFSIYRARIPKGMMSVVSAQGAKGVYSALDVKSALAGAISRYKDYDGIKSETVSVSPSLTIPGEYTIGGTVSGLHESWECHRYSVSQARFGVIARVSIGSSYSGQTIKRWDDMGIFRVEKPQPGWVRISRMVVENITSYHITDVRGYAPAAGYVETITNVWTEATRWMDDVMGEPGFGQDYPRPSPVVRVGNYGEPYVFVGRCNEASKSFDSTDEETRQYAKTTTFYGDEYGICVSFPWWLKMFLAMERHEPVTSFGDVEFRMTPPSLKSKIETPVYRYSYYSRDPSEGGGDGAEVVGYCTDVEDLMSRKGELEQTVKDGWDGETMSNMEDNTTEDPTQNQLSPFEIRIPAEIVSGRVGSTAYQRRTFDLTGVWFSVNWDFMR